MTRITITMLLAALALTTAVTGETKHKFEGDIARFEAADQKNPPKKGQVLFTGSSSTRMWKLDKSFPELDTINRGFGGSTLPDVLHFFDRVVTPYQPRSIAIYCGDNDISGGRSPEQVFEDFKTFVANVRKDVGKDVPIVYIAIKPSRARWNLWPKMKQANDLIAAWAAKTDHVTFADIAAPMLAVAEAGSPPPADLFLNDGLHLSPKGYAMWSEVVGPLVGAEPAKTE